jgi:hypothetical protein
MRLQPFWQLSWSCDGCLPFLGFTLKQKYNLML